MCGTIESSCFRTSYSWFSSCFFCIIFFLFFFSPSFSYSFDGSDARLVGSDGPARVFRCVASGSSFGRANPRGFSDALLVASGATVSHTGCLFDAESARCCAISAVSISADGGESNEGSVPAPEGASSGDVRKPFDDSCYTSWWRWFLCFVSDFWTVLLSLI